MPGAKRAEGAHDGGLGRALLPEDEDAAEAGVYEVEQQGTLHLLLAYDGAEGEVSRLRAGAWGLGAGRSTHYLKV